MSHNFINFHILISHSPSCLNRDDMNMQKNAIFGGKRRVRISSQSLKRAMRKSNYYQDNLGQNSVRTKHITDLSAKAIDYLKERYEDELVKNAISLISGKELTDKSITDDAVAPWVLEEIAWFCEQIKQSKQNNEDEKILKKKLRDSTQAMRQALVSCVDVALSGRMATSGLMSEIGKVDGALAVAHVITTHEVNDSDIDWFTAVDDLQEQGSGHLDTQEFSSGVFYRYASLNIDQLMENMGGGDRKRALEIATHVLHMLATVVPSAKQQSFAAHNLADLAMVSFSDLPVSLANAFEQPVRAKDGFLKPSMLALNTYWEGIHKGYSLDEKCAMFALNGELGIPEGIVRQDSLGALKAWVCNDGE